jgi:acetoacetyl-[acyl-carrier protein] synthase
MQAHGTGTPQNRVTESHILDQLSATYGIDRLPVAAIKAYVGHSMAPAGGDQLAAVLGTWAHGVLPGITTIDHIADDVHHDHLTLPLEHMNLEEDQRAAAFINSKGFGGNNATGLFLSPAFTESMLERRWGKGRMLEWRKRNEAVTEKALAYDATADHPDTKSIYHFGEGVVDGEELEISTEEIRIPGFGLPVRLDLTNPWADMTDD